MVGAEVERHEPTLSVSLPSSLPLTLSVSSPPTLLLPPTSLQLIPSPPVVLSLLVALLADLLRLVSLQGPARASSS